MHLALSRARVLTLCVCARACCGCCFGVLQLVVVGSIDAGGTTVLVDAGAYFHGNVANPGAEHLLATPATRAARSIFAALRYDAWMLGDQDFAAAGLNQSGGVFVAEHIAALQAHSAGLASTHAVATNIDLPLTGNGEPGGTTLLSSRHVRPYTLVALQGNQSVAFFACLDLTKLGRTARNRTVR